MAADALSVLAGLVALSLEMRAAGDDGLAYDWVAAAGKCRRLGARLRRTDPADFASADADAVGSLIGSLRREVEALERDRAAAGVELARLRRGRTALKGYREATARAPRGRIRDRK